MAYQDLEAARVQVGVVRDLVAERPGGHGDAHLLAALDLLLGSTTRALPDSLFCQRLLELRTYAHAFYSESGHQCWSRASLSGMEYLRLQLLKTLNALDARLLTIETVRLHHAEGAARPAMQAGALQR